MTWNIQNLGKSKSDETISYIANQMKSCDIVAVQEVVAGLGGAQSVAKLADELNRKGAKWEYVVSNPTSSFTKKTERYAFLWKTKQVKIKGKAWLESHFEQELEREPFMVTFVYHDKEYTLASFHAVPKKDHPEIENAYFEKIAPLYPHHNLLFMGDFNLSEKNDAFDGLKSLGYHPIITKQKTSLKIECKEDECLASEYDNIFMISSHYQIHDKGVLHFYKDFETLKDARKISDHIPVWISLD